MGWLIILILALLTFAGLWYFVRDKAAVQLLSAALLIALAGYAWQGRPGLAGRPKAPAERQQVAESEFASMRQNLLGRFDRAAAWLTMAEGFQRRGDTRTGVEIIQAGIRDSPQDPDLWVGLGNALVVHANGMMSPAAQLAFQRAAAIAPNHPGPRFFYGLALAQGGNYDEAERIWRGLLPTLPADSQYRTIIEQRLQALAQARASGELPPAVAPSAADAGAGGDGNSAAPSTNGSSGR